MDSREISHKWYCDFDEKSMTLTLEEVGEPIPARYEVCPTCRGKGRHVNPSIDRNGLTAADFAEDPDLFEHYMSGMYDVACAECHGHRLVPVVDEERATREQIDAAERQAREFFADQAEQWHAREHGY